MKLNIIKLYNTLSRKKEEFIPINFPFVGIYLCGPTVYSDAHLGHARSAITFDILVRYLRYLDYKVKFVRNITDVGHLERDSDDGEDKMAKKAKLEEVDVMEIAQKYTESYHKDLEILNVLKPNIEPIASGHIIEQINLTKELINKGYAYEVNGSVYFDVMKYQKSKKGNYGKLSGRVIEDLISNTRELSGQEDKRFPLDFALWKKASPKHIMRWNSPWGEGFPGWHLECSAMSYKYLGAQFDIHGGGMDLCFPHHECEIAQSVAAHSTIPAKYWMHNNMVTVNGQKMSKSLNNFITLQELFLGKHKLLDKAYNPMVLRFFILQAHYRSTLSFSIDALKGAEKGYLKLINTLKDLKKLKYINKKSGKEDKTVLNTLEKIYNSCFEAINDDINTAKLIAELFELTKIINTFINQDKPLFILGSKGFNELKSFYITFIENILGLREEKITSINTFLSLLLNIYTQAKKDKNYEVVDNIRIKLRNEGIVLEDKKGGVSWRYETST